jgi:hypothetical protein
MATKPRKGGGELYYLDEHGNKQDAELHEEILSQGDHAAAKAVSDKIKARILKEAGIDPDTPWTATEADIAALTAAAKRSRGK